MGPVVLNRYFNSVLERKIDHSSLSKSENFNILLTEHKGLTLVEKIANSVKNQIIKNSYPEKSRLDINLLANHYGVSYGTVREALIGLVEERYLIFSSTDGFRVAPMSIHEFRHIIELRKLLEVEALKNSIKNGDEKWEGDVMFSHHRLSSLENEFGIGKFEDYQMIELWGILHSDFHASLLLACDSLLHIEFVGVLYKQSERYLLSCLRNCDFSVKNLLDDHVLIRDAAINRDIKHCCTLLNEHLEDTYDALSRFIN